ncbi:hypothetical protein BSR25_0006 [Lactococcus lactis subsp. lactis bv. diacetylactis]|nr:hypothetical protein BSR25_0006 [Lactococcus lactis subsp. lactis bv. diacetylactis]
MLDHKNINVRIHNFAQAWSAWAFYYLLYSSHIPCARLIKVLK